MNRVIRGCLDESTYKAAGVLFCHSSGMGYGGGKCASVGLGGRDDAGGQSSLVKLLAALWCVEVEGLDVFPFGLRSTRAC